MNFWLNLEQNFGATVKIGPKSKLALLSTLPIYGVNFKLDFWIQCFSNLVWYVSRIQKSHPHMEAPESWGWLYPQCAVSNQTFSVNFPILYGAPEVTNVCLNSITYILWVKKYFLRKDQLLFFVFCCKYNEVKKVTIIFLTWSCKL